MRKFLIPISFETENGLCICSEDFFHDYYDIVYDVLRHLYSLLSIDIYLFSSISFSRVNGLLVIDTHHVEFQ